MVSEKLSPRKIVPRSGSGFGISVRIMAGGQFSSGAIFLNQEYNLKFDYDILKVIMKTLTLIIIFQKLLQKLET